MGKFIVGMIMTIVIMVVLFIGLRMFFCGPNQSDVRVMKSMGDKINRYLVTKGKPDSLDSIPNLPYKLKCSSKYNCSFIDDEKLYKIWIDDNYYVSSFTTLSHKVI